MMLTSKRKPADHDFISALARAQDRTEPEPLGELFSTALMLVFFLSLMGALVAGALMYRHAAQAQQQADDLHLEAGLLTNVIRANDLTGAVRQGQGPEGPALVLSRTLGSRTYETRIYRYQGHVVEETSMADRAFDPANATRLMETETFDLSFDGNLITLSTDEGSFDVALRSDGALSGTGEGGGA